MASPKRLLSKPALLTISINIEGLSTEKEILLSDMCRKHKCDILLIQETHRGPNDRRPRIKGMKLVLERPNEQYGSAVFTRADADTLTANLTCSDDIEVLTVELKSCTITSVYKPPNKEFKFTETQNFHAQQIKIIMGDFNCHSPTWGYREMDKNGQKLTEWAECMNLKLIHDPKLPCSFNSGRWRKGFNPDNIFVTNNIAQQTRKYIAEPLPRTQHRALICEVQAIVNPSNAPFRRQFNFKKADWVLFSKNLDEEVGKIEPVPGRYTEFVELVRGVSRKHIPRGCRRSYIPGLDGDSKILLDRYIQLFEDDPFAEETMHLGERLLQAISASRTERWRNLLGSLDMKKSSRQAWKLLKNLNGDPTSSPPDLNETTPDKIAHRLLLNGKSSRRPRERRTRRYEVEADYLGTPFALGELRVVIQQMKNNKAAGTDDIRPEQIKHFGPLTEAWILKLMNNCVSGMTIPKIWRKSRVVALLKPGKEPNDPKNFRPISLLCHLYKALERLVLNRISDCVDNKIINEQAGFRPGRSCCGQILNLTQFIEDGYERKHVTGAVFIDLTAAYDTVNHKRLARKLYLTTRDFRLTQLVESLLRNRRFFVMLKDKKSRWRNQKNGLPQGSVLAPLLFNIYTNDQPINTETRMFIYADDTAIAAQARTFEEVEHRLTSALEDMACYYDENHLKPNPVKTQICAFHLRNREARRELNVTWRGHKLINCEQPRYLGVKLDRTLSYKQHCLDTKQKVFARNNLVRKLTSTRWGASPDVLRSSALALGFSAAEYAAPVWRNSVHAPQVDVALHETGRIVTGCLKPTPVNRVFPLMGIAPPDVRRQVAAEVERRKQETDPRHPMYGVIAHPPRLKSRKSFLHTTTPIKLTPKARRIELWRNKAPEGWEIKESPVAGFHLTYGSWKTLNRLRTGVTRCRANLKRWGYVDEEVCDCGEVQDSGHLLVCRLLSEPCDQHDLMEANDRALQTVAHWQNHI